LHSKIETIKDAAFVMSAILIINQDDQLFIWDRKGKVRNAMGHTLRDGSKMEKVTRLWANQVPYRNTDCEEDYNSNFAIIEALTSKGQTVLCSAGHFNYDTEYTPEDLLENLESGIGRSYSERYPIN
jgi:hypothetical protein